ATLPILTNPPNGKKRASKHGPTLTGTQIDDIAALMKEFSDVFAENPDCPPTTDAVQHDIDVQDHAPIRQPPYRVPPAKIAIQQEIVNKWLEAGIIRVSDSPWSSPVVLVKKPEGEWRFCVDYRQLNAVTRKDATPLPRIDDTLHQLRDAKYISRFDLAAAYNQIKMSPKSVPLTAFSTATGHYEFLRMPFGLTNAPARLQRLMNTIFRHHKHFVRPYLDDIIIYSTSWSEHLQHIRQVFQILREAQLKVKES